MSRFLVMLVVLLVPFAAQAQDVDVDANINLHLTLGSYAGCTDSDFDYIDQTDCAGLANPAVNNLAFAWVVVSREGGLANGIGGAQFGIETSIAFDAWTLCTGGSQIVEAGWPQSGTGNAVTWSNGCYEPAGANAKAGFFTVSNGAMGAYRITYDPRINDAQYADCNTSLFSICVGNLGKIDHGSGAAIMPVCGDNCDAVPTREVTWSEIKSLF